MTRTEHLIENALVAVTSGKTAEEYKEKELTFGGNTPTQLLDMVYEMAQYVHYTWNEGKIVDGSINEINVDEIKAGDRFTYLELEYVCLEVFDKEVYGHKAMLAVTAEIIKTMQYAEKNENCCNDWRASEIRAWLNDDFLGIYTYEDDMILQVSDLTADNGDNTYGTCADYIALLSCEQYRKYRKLMPKYDDCVWTVTPYSCTSDYADYVRTINPLKGLSSYNAENSFGVAPVCLFNLDSLHLNRHICPVHSDKSKTKI